MNSTFLHTVTEAKYWCNYLWSRVLSEYSQWVPFSEVQWNYLWSEMLFSHKWRHMRSPVWLIICGYYCVVRIQISYEVLSVTKIKGKKKTHSVDNSLAFSHFCFKWEVYESVIFSLHIYQAEDILWNSAPAYWCVPCNLLKVSGVCPFCSFCLIVVMEKIPGVFSISRLFMNLCRQENVNRKRNMF